MSDFAKNLAAPLARVEPQPRIRQKTQFTRVLGSWDILLNNMVNPGMMSASSLIEETRIALLALQDICAERLPLGIKIKSLAMLFMAGPQNQPKNLDPPFRPTIIIMSTIGLHGAYCHTDMG